MSLQRPCPTTHQLFLKFSAPGAPGSSLCPEKHFQLHSQQKNLKNGTMGALAAQGVKETPQILISQWEDFPMGSAAGMIPLGRSIVPKPIPEPEAPPDPSFSSPARSTFILTAEFFSSLANISLHISRTREMNPLRSLWPSPPSCFSQTRISPPGIFFPPFHTTSELCQTSPGSQNPGTGRAQTHSQSWILTLLSTLLLIQALTFAKEKKK